MPLTASQRSQRAKLAAETRWSRTPDRRQATSTARETFNARFEREVDARYPPETITPEQRAQMIASARSAYFTKLRLRSSIARTASA